MMATAVIHWVDAIVALQALGEDYVLITLLGARGSTPRENGTKMVVSKDANFGTIGGGHLEFKATCMAADLLNDEQEQQKIEYFPLGPSLGQCCGGSTTVLFESFKGTDFNIALFGAGHVGLALADILKQLPCKLHWIDNREDTHPSPLPNHVTPIVSEQPADEVADMLPGSYYLIMTHNHQLDYEILETVLNRGDAAYVGLIGSDTKWRRFKMRMDHRGYQPEFYRQVHCPIGLAEVPGKRPIEVAVSIAGELIGLNNAAEQTKTKQRGVSRAQAKEAIRELSSSDE
ncbi:MAG: xanthine dehydrogenase accessory factor [Halioglobus sp.]|jgi:xanthine dehydrogenase accessory factor